MRVHKDGYIQCRRLTLWMPRARYLRAINVGMYRNDGIEKEIEQLLDVELSGELRFRAIDIREEMVRIQVDSDWVQPTRS